MSFGGLKFSGKALREAVYALDRIGFKHFLHQCPSLEHLNEVGPTSKQSALHRACAAPRDNEEDRVPIIHGLLRAGIDPNLQDAKGNTALHCLLQNGASPKPESLMMLIAMGARVDLANNEGKRPIDLVAPADAFAREVLENVANRTKLLHLCIKKGLVWPLRILLDHATDEEINTNIKGISLFRHAFDARNWGVASLLALYGHAPDLSIIKDGRALPENDWKKFHGLLNFMILSEKHELSARLRGIVSSIQRIFPSRLFVSEKTFGAVRAAVDTKLPKAMEVVQKKDKVEQDMYKIACQATILMEEIKSRNVQEQVCGYVSMIAAALMALDPELVKYFGIDILLFKFSDTAGHQINSLVVYEGYSGGVSMPRIIFDAYNPGAMYTMSSSRGSVVSISDECGGVSAFHSGDRIPVTVAAELRRFKAIFGEVLAERTRGASAAGVGVTSASGSAFKRGGELAPAGGAGALAPAQPQPAAVVATSGAAAMPAPTPTPAPAPAAAREENTCAFWTVAAAAVGVAAIAAGMAFKNPGS